jgi:hypothetical protein
VCSKSLLPKSGEEFCTASQKEAAGLETTAKTKPNTEPRSPVTAGEARNHRGAYSTAPLSFSWIFLARALHVAVAGWVSASAFMWAYFAITDALPERSRER